MSGSLNIPGSSSGNAGAPTPMNSFVTGGLTAPGSSSTQPTVEDVDEEEEVEAEQNPASLLANVSSCACSREDDEIVEGGRGKGSCDVLGMEAKEASFPWSFARTLS
jgi:hypothetical protein